MYIVRYKWYLTIHKLALLKFYSYFDDLYLYANFIQFALNSYLSIDSSARINCLKSCLYFLINKSSRFLLQLYIKSTDRTLEWCKSIGLHQSLDFHLNLAGPALADHRLSIGSDAQAKDKASKMLRLLW